ncbi:hypothetical protein QBC34DRAFT_405066 [Podospora aff. communis PSN243]|uniref:Uncharacterized protein n=1 Tax=Podospora aff. communis PSN243 TaxID=3040156 RepID=A0AAV9GKZ1_9PEZI|nr:hypothetical protein QBC34DRAFT_405066 [Podospora aff. communis PSN243]
MSSPEKTLEAIQQALGPYVKPREEASQIRRILALHIQSCLGDASVPGPLALVNSSKPVPLSSSRGLQREYLEALNANIQAYQEHDVCRSETPNHQDEPSTTQSSKADLLQEHLAMINLQKKQERLQAIEKHIELLNRKPAASAGFLDPNEMFRDSKPLPEVPRDIVTALALDDAPASTRLKELIDQLEKHVLRAKLQLKREEQLLEQVKSRSSVAPGAVTNSAKLEALNISRTELINWIEVELGKAGDGGAEDTNDTNRESQGLTNTARLDEQLAGVRTKYSQYLEARKLLLQLVSQQSKPVIKPLADNAQPPAIPAATPQPRTHLLPPYLEQLLSVAHEQRGLIAQKSHFNLTIARQLKDTVQALDHLADESQLIPAHPMPGAARRKPAGFGDALSASETLDSSSRVKPWVFAADSAKIATLEAVAEKIEEGQIALEGSMRIISEIGQLLHTEVKTEAGVGDESVEDIWLTEGRPAGKSAASRKPKTKTKPQDTRDVWDVLDGNLGLL